MSFLQPWIHARALLVGGIRTNRLIAGEEKILPVLQAGCLMFEEGF